MIDRYMEMIRDLLPEINDEMFLHEVYREILMHIESQEAKDGPPD